MSISLKVLMDDTASANHSLTAEHGLSFFVETPQSVFVFDFGATGTAWVNAARMHADLHQLDFAVCSHAHYDHAGGFKELLQQVHIPTLFTGEGFFNEKYAFSKAENKYTYLGAGFGPELLTQQHITHRVCTDVLRLDDFCCLMGGFERRCAFETIPERFVLNRQPVPDSFNDEICLVLREKNGLAVITGCAHPGILNMVTAVHEHFQLPIYSVIGGTHLVEADTARIDMTLKKFNEMQTERLGLCHCSGELVRERLRENSIAACLLSVGDVIDFD